MDYEALIEQANIRISILEKQRNDAMNQTLNALTELNIVASQLQQTRDVANLLAEKNAELAAQLNTQAEELDRLRAARPRKRKIDGTG